MSDRASHIAPLGPLVDATPAERPAPVTLTGRHGRVERLGAQHVAALWEATRSDDEVWAYMNVGPFATSAAFGEWIESQLAAEDPYFYAILDRAGRALGLAALMEIRPANRVIEVGHIVYASALQRTPLATEAQHLLARYAFETLGYRRYEWKCNALNAPSRRAALRFGFTFEGVFRQHMIVKGRSRDTAWYAMLDNEWPARKAAFERWLAPDNFDGGGRQKKRLEELRT